MRILVLDGEERASLAVVRSLVKAGYQVTVAASSTWALATRSRGVTPVVLKHRALDDSLAYSREVSELVRRQGCAVLIPVTDASLEAILEHRDLLDREVQLPLASLQVYRAASDKLLVHRVACEFGIGIDETVVVARKGDPVPDDPALFPGVVKPHRSVIGGARRVKTSVRLVANREECALAIDALPEEAFPVLVQRRVRGPGEGYFVARWGGETIARFAHRRLREKPPSGGVSVFRESLAVSPELRRAGDAMLDRLDWNGVAMIEGKRDLDRGGWRVMEINGRFWGSLQLAIDAGVDFPALLVAATLGRPASAPDWRTGVRLRWEWGDLDHLLLRLARSRERLNLSSESPSRLAAIGQFLTHQPGRDRFEVFRLRDPMPFVAETLLRAGLVR